VVAESFTKTRGSVADLLGRTGQSDFEETFVQLAFPSTAADAGAAA